jgi:DNA-binding transcriptional LysR family regulator
LKDHFAGIREFVAVVDSGSLTAAAMSLGVTGSAIGKSISKLEARLGVQLLHRTTRRINLTAEGDAYLASCRLILEEIKQTEAFLSTGNNQPIGRLRIDLPTTFGRRHIIPTLLDLSSRFKDLDLSVNFQDRVVDMVSEGVDIAVRIGALGDLPDLIARKLGEQRLIICASEKYLKSRGVPMSRADLKQHDCLIGRRKDNRPYWQLKTDQGGAEFYEVPVRHELNDGDALLNACLSGNGLAQLPNWLAKDALLSGDLIPVLSKLSGVAMPIHVIWQKTRHVQPKVRITVDEIVKLSLRDYDIFNP